jgi:hypothetical protein
MRTAAKFAALLMLGAALVLSGCSKKKFTSWDYVQKPAVATQLKSFVADKIAQVNSATNEAAPGFEVFFAAAKKGDWLTVSNAFADFQNHAPQYDHAGTNDDRLTGTPWAAVLETYGAFEALHYAGEKYFNLYATNVIQSIPPGSIYFGGTDGGRFIITAMQKSQVNADPFFTLTQNALADSSYLDYLRNMYGDKIYIPTQEELKQCYQDYTDDALKRQQNHQLKQGEHVTMGKDGKPEVSGLVAVMAINGLIAKVIFDKNPHQDFYVQQSFPLDWMYPYLEPHGQIFKINREPLAELSDEAMQDDDDYWTQTISPIIGNWLTKDTPVTNVVAFAGKVFFRHDFSGFSGDRDFVENKYDSGLYAWDRSNIAELYLWRMNHTTNLDEKDRMAQEADFAFRQALALNPTMTQTVRDYEAFLRSQGRTSDAFLIGKIGRQPRNSR